MDAMCRKIEVNSSESVTKNCNVFKKDNNLR